MFLKNRIISSKIKKSKVTDYAALMVIWVYVSLLFGNRNKYRPKWNYCVYLSMTTEEKLPFLFSFFFSGTDSSFRSLDTINIIKPFSLFHHSMILLCDNSSHKLESLHVRKIFFSVLTTVEYRAKIWRQ